MRLRDPDHHHPQPRMPFGSAIPPTPAEEAAAADLWERRGVFGRLVRRP
jgi:hypothetical protein